ncbi:MAG TPA: XRE family transcriptional regulator [Chloroflexi bacterium]|nr:XRE family transcriptional regulator [Chloroflexota bacterium]
MLSADPLPEPNWDAFLGHLPVVLERVDMVPSNLATALGLDRSAVSHWLAGRARPSRENLRAMARELRRAFSSPLELLDWMELAGWRPSEEDLRRWFPHWFAEHGKLPRGPRLVDQRYVLRPAGRMVGREEELALVRGWLTSAEGFRRPAVRVVTIGGMAGVGKTTLARAVGEDPLIEAYFRDGVLWARLGPQPNPRRWMLEWARLLGWTPQSGGPAGRYLARFLADGERRVLLILDDVWPNTPFDPLIALAGPQTRVLITSQVLTIAELYGRNRLLRLGLPDHEEAVAMARDLLPPEMDTKEQARWLPILGEIVEAVGRLPVAIRVAVAVSLLEGPEQVLRDLRAKEDVAPPRPERVLRLEIAGPDPRQSKAWAAFEVGYEALEEEDRRRFRALGNLPTGTSFGVKVLAALWEEDIEWAEAAARRLVRRSLLEQVGGNRYTLHTLLHDFAAARAEEAGERDVKGKWTERVAVALVGKPPWWRPVIPRVWTGPKPFSREWWVQGKEEFLRDVSQMILPWRREAEGISVETWATGKALLRLIDRYTLWFVLELSLLLILTLATAVLTVLDVPSWLIDGVIEAIFYLDIVILFSTGWALVIRLMDLHRLYHLPKGPLEAGEAADRITLSGPAGSPQ